MILLLEVGDIDRRPMIVPKNVISLTKAGICPHNFLCTIYLLPPLPHLLMEKMEQGKSKEIRGRMISHLVCVLL